MRCRRDAETQRRREAGCAGRWMPQPRWPHCRGALRQGIEGRERSPLCRPLDATAPVAGRTGAALCFRQWQGVCRHIGAWSVAPGRQPDKHPLSLGSRMRAGRRAGLLQTPRRAPGTVHGVGAVTDARHHCTKIRGPMAPGGWHLQCWRTLDRTGGRGCSAAPVWLARHLNTQGRSEARSPFASQASRRHSDPAASHMPLLPMHGPASWTPTRPRFSFYKHLGLNLRGGSSSVLERCSGSLSCKLRSCLLGCSRKNC
jgi:hypothetical protein